MSAWAWVGVFAGIAVAGLVMVALFAVWLWRLARLLLDEVGVLLERADTLLGLVDQIGRPEPPSDEGRPDSAAEDLRMGASSPRAT